LVSDLIGLYITDDKIAWFLIFSSITLCWCTSSEKLRCF